MCWGSYGDVVPKCWGSYGDVVPKCWGSYGDVVPKCWRGAGKVPGTNLSSLTVPSEQEAVQKDDHRQKRTQVENI